jgi:anti-sigma factor RsiW
MIDAKNEAMSGDERLLLIHAYVDGELDPVNSLSLGRQIAEEPSLRAEVERIQALRRAVGERFPREALPPHMMSKIETAIGQIRDPMRISWRALAASVALAMVLASSSTWFAMRHSGEVPFGESIIDSHLRALVAPSPTDVSSSERHLVKPWFNGRIAQSPQVVDLAKEGFPLIGGRIDVVDAKPVATLVYGRRLHLISLSAAQSGQRNEAPTFSRSINGYNLVHWSENGFSYWAVSDLNVPELLTFARSFQAGLSATPRPVPG